jgi:hypothetical protein
MSNLLSNTFLDVCGITRAVLYRTFIERRWSPPQPMFNVLEVKPGKTETFELFLSQAQTISGKLGSPVSLGPYKTGDTQIYIYVTHYASTWSFIRVMFRLTLTFVVLKRAAATAKTSWTYCHPTNGPALSGLSQVLVVGIRGDDSGFRELLRERNLSPAATVECVKDVRGRSLGTYFVLPEAPEHEAVLDGFRSGGGDLIVYKASTFEVATSKP